MPDNKIKFTQTKAFRLLMWGLGILALVLIIFQAGFKAGTHRAFFNCKWGENYARNFGETAPPFAPFAGGPGAEAFSLRMPSGPASMSGHGVIGEVIAIDAEGFVVRGLDDTERFIVTATSTSLVRQRQRIQVSDLKVGDVVNVIGRPDEIGRIAAQLIRVMPGGLPISR